MAVGSTGGILKSTCICFLSGTVSSVFKVGVSGTSGSAEGASGMLNRSCLGYSARNVCSAGRFDVGGRLCQVLTRVLLL